MSPTGANTFGAEELRCGPKGESVEGMPRTFAALDGVPVCGSGVVVKAALVVFERARHAESDLRKGAIVNFAFSRVLVNLVEGGGRKEMGRGKVGGLCGPPKSTSVRSGDCVNGRVEKIVDNLTGGEGEGPDGPPTLAGGT